MKKTELKSPRPLQLNRETLRLLESAALQTVPGAAPTGIDTTSRCGVCPN